jgi:hypothetical protein
MKMKMARQVAEQLVSENFGEIQEDYSIEKDARFFTFIVRLIK